MRTTTFLPAPTESESFARLMTARLGKRSTTVCFGLYVSALAINSNGDIFAGADFINGAGGVFRSTDNGQSWVEVNQGVITTDVRALAINSDGDIFAGTYPSGGVLPLDRQRRELDPGEQRFDLHKYLVTGDQFERRIFAGTAGCGQGVLSFDRQRRSLDTGQQRFDFYRYRGARDQSEKVTSLPELILSSVSVAASSARSTTAIRGRSKIMVSPRSM